MVEEWAILPYQSLQLTHTNSQTNYYILVGNENFIILVILRPKYIKRTYDRKEVCLSFFPHVSSPKVLNAFRCNLELWVCNRRCWVNIIFCFLVPLIQPLLSMNLKPKFIAFLKIRSSYNKTGT